MYSNLRRRCLAYRKSIVEITEQERPFLRFMNVKRDKYQSSKRGEISDEFILTPRQCKAQLYNVLKKFHLDTCHIPRRKH